MKMTVATSDGIGYASKTPYEWDGKEYEADIQNGDEVAILDAGAIETGQFGDQHYFKIKTRNGDKKAPFNQSSINVLVPEFGEESEDWAGKKVKILTKKGVFAGKKGIACYFVTDGWYLDDFGDLVKDEVKNQTTKENAEIVSVDPDKEYPTNNLEDSPF